MDDGRCYYGADYEHVASIPTMLGEHENTKEWKLPGPLD